MIPPLLLTFSNNTSVKAVEIWSVGNSGSYTEACWKDFRDHGNATVEGQDLASTYVLCPCPRTGCPDFGMDQKGVMGQSVMEQRCDGAEV